MADINIKILKDENGDKFFPCTSIKGVIGEEYVHSVFPASEVEAGHFVITHDYLTEEEILNKVIAISFPENIEPSAQSYLKLNEGEEYPLMNEGGLTPLILTDLKNVVCFIMKKTDSWQLVKTGAAGSAGGSGGHVIVDEEYNIMPQRSLLRFAGLSISDDEVRDATVIGTPKLISNLTTETEGLGPLDAYQGKVLNDKIDTNVLEIKSLIPEVVDDITSTSGTKALSANQGYVLNSKFNNYLPLGGGTITGTLGVNNRLTAGELYLNGNMFWEGTKNITCISRANNIEWSFDLGSTEDGSNAGHTGTYAQFWSMKNQNTIISFHNDDDMVNIPNGKLHIHPQNSWHEGNNYDLRLGRADANHLDLGYDGMQAKNSSNGAAKLFFQYGGGDTQFGRDGASSNLIVYGNISLANERAIHKGGSSYSWSTIRDSNTTALASITSYSGYHPILKQKTPSGVWGLGCYTSAVHFTYFADGTTHNSPTQLLELNYNGNNIYAGGAALPHVWVQSGQPSAKQTGDIWFIP